MKILKKYDDFNEFVIVDDNYYVRCPYGIWYESVDVFKGGELEIEFQKLMKAKNGNKEKSQ